MINRSAIFQHQFLQRNDVRLHSPSGKDTGCVNGIPLSTHSQCCGTSTRCLQPFDPNRVTPSTDRLARVRFCDRGGPEAADLRSSRLRPIFEQSHNLSTNVQSWWQHCAFRRGFWLKFSSHWFVPIAGTSAGPRRVNGDRIIASYKY